MPPVAITVCIYCEPTVPLGSDAVVIVRGAITTVKVRVALAEAPVASVTLTEMVDVPWVVGVPEINPVASPVRGGGNPEMAHVYGVVPPVALSVVEYGEPTVAFAREDVVMVRAATTITVTDAVAGAQLESPG